MKLGWFLWPALSCVMFLGSGDAFGFGGFVTELEGDLIDVTDKVSKYTNGPSNRPAKLANDGGESTDGTRDCAVAKKSPDNRWMWWEVDLGKQYFINYVEVLSRSDCCGSDLALVAAMVANEDAAHHRSIYPTDKGQFFAAMCNFHNGMLELGTWTRFPCIVQGVGRYVMLFAHPQTPFDTMVICEVRVHGFAPEPEDQGKLQNGELDWVDKFYEHKP